MAVQDYKINYKSDFVLTINGDAGWATQFCIKFWTGMPSQAYFVGFDGVKYVNCRVGDTPTQLLVMFDDHHLPIGKLMMQIAYHTTIEEFPGSVFDEVTNARDVIVTIDGTDYQVMLDFTGEDAPELEFDLPAYANEAERIQNELQRQQNEADRIAAELQREQATAAAVQGAENVNAQLNGTTLTVTNRQGVSTSVNTKGEQGAQGPVGPEGPQGEQGVSIVSFLPKSETSTTLIYTITYSNGYTQDVAIPKGPKGDAGATGPTGPQGPQGVSVIGFTQTGETATNTMYNLVFSDGRTQSVAIPKGEKGAKGDTGNPGPQGEQGPKGDTVIIGDEQTYTLYGVTGQNSDGAMTQKAVTDALVGSAIAYDNSQSGLASDNMQEALDEVETHINNLPISQIEEIYFAIADSNGETAFKVDENGIDAKDVGSNLVEAISRIIVEKAYIYKTNEDGFYICDANGNAAVKQDNEKLYFSSDYVTRDEMWDALQDVTRRSFTPEIVNIKIETQTQFDNLDSTICNAINETGSEPSQINIFLKNGVYKFNDAITFSTLDSSKKEADNVELNICSSIGEKATIVSDGDEYTPDDAIAFTDTHYICNRKTPYVKGEGYVDQNFRKVETTDTGRINAGGINQMDSLFEHVSGTTYRIRLTEELSFLKNKSSSYFANSIVYNSAWFWIFTRTPLYTDGTYLYVDASENANNINQDYTFAQQYPTIYITNVIDKMDADCVCNYDGKIYIPRKVTKLYTCKKCKFMELEDIAFSKLSISDIDFCGTSDFTGKINNNDIFGEASDKLFDFVDCKNIYITSCNFVSVGNQSVIGGRSTNSNYSIANPEAEINNGVGLYIKDNKFTSLQGFGIFSFMEKTEITGNEFYDVGLVTHFGACVSVTGKDYYVANNKMVNCSYAGIRIGDGTDGRKATRCVSGIVENNEIYNETQALIEYKRRTLMDGGAIYLFTHHDDTTVRFNIIHDYRFKHECRGIFGDDGTYNVNVYGNVIWNIHDRYIDIRRVTWSSSNTQGQPNNVNVKVGHNILFGDYLIGGCNNLTEGNSSGYETNGCEVKRNLLCSIRQTVPYSGTITNITSVETDLKSGYSDFKDGKVFTDTDISDFELNEFINNRIFKIQ